MMYLPTIPPSERFLAAIGRVQAATTPTVPPEETLALLFLSETGLRIPAGTLRDFLKGPQWRRAATLAHQIHGS